MDKVQAGQCLMDIAIQEAGSVEALFDIAAANGLSMTSDLTPGNSLTVPAVLDARAVLFLKQKKIKPAAGGILPLDGIGYWIIEQNFVVQ